jgi:hypothetical protein
MSSITASYCEHYSFRQEKKTLRTVRDSAASSACKDRVKEAKWLLTDKELLLWLWKLLPCWMLKANELVATPPCV